MTKEIDGTLVRRAGPHHREALVEAVRAVTGLDTTTENIPVHGMLDPDILARMMRDAGAPEELIARWLPAIMRRAPYRRLRSDAKTAGRQRRVQQSAIPHLLSAGALLRLCRPLLGGLQDTAGGPPR